jgi:hypothetical protein
MAHPAIKQTETGAIHLRKFVIFSSLSLDGRCGRLATTAIHTHVNAQRNGCVTAEQGIRKTLLAVAIIKAQLGTPHLPVRYAIGRPGTKPIACTGVLGQRGQILQADSFVVFGMA